jgi:glycosyltransferase involved in cell wall biosynthesis
MTKTAKKGENLRIFLGLIEIAGYYTNLERGFRQLNISARHIDAYSHSFKYRSHKINKYLNAVQNIGTPLLKPAELHPIHKGLLIIVHKILLVPVFLWAILKFDVFIFGFGTSFFYYLDLPVLKLLGKKILYIFHGSDTRAPYLDGFIGSDLSTTFLQRICSNQKKAITKIEKYADDILSYPHYAHLNARKVASHIFVGLPVELKIAETVPGGPIDQQKVIRILHCPSNTCGKGTDRIRSSVDRLIKRGFEINYVEITNKPHSVVLSELAKCDFVIDQLYSDTPMAGFAAEAAFFGKPAIVGGYGWEWLETMYPEEYLPPTSRCLPSQIEKTIERMIVDHDYRVELGSKAHDFVTRMWRPSVVAQKILCIAKGQTPESWYFDPIKIRYVYGAGIPRDTLKKRVKELIVSQGLSALCLQDKPALESQFTNLAHSVKATHNQV